MGDIFSKKSQSTTNTTLNQQVALQGRGQVGVSGSTIVGDINVTSSDPETVAAALETVNESLRQQGTASNNAALTALASVNASANVANRAINAGDTALGVAGIAITGANQSVMKTLEALSQYQDRALSTVDNAVAAAQQTALLATPQSPAAYAEVTKGQDSKTIVIVGISILAAVGVVAYLLTHE